MKILIVFFHGNMFAPKAGNESRMQNVVKQLSKKNKIFTLESTEYKNELNTSFVEKRYFFNPFILKNIHFGTFFADLNPSYIFKLYKIIKENKPDMIHISYPQGLFVAKVLTKFNKISPYIVYEAHDVEAKRLNDVVLTEQDVQAIKRWVSYLYGSMIERISCKLVDHIITVSEKDKDEFIKRYSLDKNKITVIPTGTVNPDLKNYNKINCKKKLGVTEDKAIILFHGVYDYYPNKEAVKLITKYIAPKIHEEHEKVLFAIAGKGAPKYEDEKIKYLGFVDDLNELLVASDIAIVPVLTGGGTRVKILDYIGAGLPIVTTKKGIEGINANNGKHAIIVDDVNEEFIEAINYLIENNDERERLGRTARKLAEEEYDWNTIGEKLNRLYSNLIKYKMRNK